MADDLSKQVETPVVDHELAALKTKASVLQVAYFVLFALSLILIIYNRQSNASSDMHMLWAFVLGAAVLTRLVRSHFVNKYNARLNGGRPAPLS
jgi:hypothetical protein